LASAGRGLPPGTRAVSSLDAAASRRQTQPARHGEAAASYLVLFLGTLVDADAALITAAFLAHRGRLSLAAVVTVCVVAIPVAYGASGTPPGRFAALELVSVA